MGPTRSDPASHTITLRDSRPTSQLPLEAHYGIYHYCHPSAEDLSRRVAAFETRLNQDACAVADRLWVKDHLDPDEEKLRFSR